MVRRKAFVLACLALVGCAGILGLDEPVFFGSPSSSPGGPEGDGGPDGKAAPAPDASKCGPRGPQLLASGLSVVWEIAIDDKAIYFTSFDRQLLGRVDKDCTNRFDLRPEGGIQEPTGLTLQGNHVYWTAYGSGDFADFRNGVRRIQKDGGGVESIERCNTALDLQVDEQFIYAFSDVCDSGWRLRRYPKDDRDGGFVESFSEPDGEYGYATYGYMGADKDRVYWAGKQTVRALPKKFGPDAAGTIVAASPDETIQAIAVDDRLYVLTASGLFAYDKTGATKPVALATDLKAEKGRAGIALDAKHVYFTQPGGGLVGRVLRDGKSFEVVAKDQALPSGIAVDDEWVYWTNAGDGTVWRTPK